MRRKNVFSMDVPCLQYFCFLIEHPERLISTWSGDEPSFINGFQFYALSSTTSFYLFYYWYYYFYFFTCIFLKFQIPYSNSSIHVAEGNNNLKINRHFMWKRQLSKSFTVVIQPLSTRLIKPNFCFDLSHRRSTTVSLETRNPYISWES